MDELIMMIDDRPHRGWTEAVIGRSIERGPHEFDLTLTDNWGASEGINPRSIEIGMPVQAYVNDDLLLTGYMDDVDPEYDKDSHTIKARGRSKLGDLVDCSTKGKSFSNVSLLTVCQQLCALFDITVSVADNVSEAVNKPFIGKDYTLDLGQPIWEFIEELARLRAVLLTSDASGNLLITRAGNGTADEALVLGENISRASGSFSAKELFSDYTVTGQHPNHPTVKLNGINNSQSNAQAKAKGSIARFRPFVVSSQNPIDQAACHTRAEWQRNVNEGRSIGVIYTVTGWRQQADGRIWQPNELVHVTDPWMGWDDERLIVESRLSLGEAGSLTELRVMPKTAFDLIPEVERASGEVEINR